MMYEAETISERIDDLALANPERVCYETEEALYSYGTLSLESDRVAKWLCAHFSGREPILVFGGLEFQMIVCFIACVKTGHPYIPIDKHTPISRLLEIIRVAKPICLFEGGSTSLVDMDADIKEQLPEIISAPFLASIRRGDDIENSEKSAISPKPCRGSEDFYTIFTSGTTGGLKKAPKGVRICHDNLVTFTDWIGMDFGINNGAKWLLQAPFSFDLSVMSLYPALLTGGSLVPIHRETVDNFQALYACLPKLGVEIWVSTPSFVDLCLLNEEFSEESNPEIRHFLFCGEELLRSTALKLTERFPSAKIYNLYGPTEATVAVTEVLITPELLKEENRLPVGRPKRATKMVILGEDDLPCAEGDIGEIAIVGSSVANGYLNNPEATDAAFFEYEGFPAYRTGDAGNFGSDGNLYFKGRLDFQIKLNGYRIELEDVDHYLNELPSVNAAATVAVYQDGKVQSLTAFIVASEDLPQDSLARTKAIRSQMRGRVMDYMIPRKFVFVEHLPLTQNGKVNRKKLMEEVNKCNFR
ncbi:MAG: D-alanine--poly(phosphoribitol) ligase subunit DltA [Clostridiales Family XIII bacterium]|jgi:D-alanine--poly(phosphoribitol) ligase subunit 1|nr:D-alanine--poly(phosphoribitol) ligase subunit DltA [Clostridiales Family XIII bacterium]